MEFKYTTVEQAVNALLFEAERYTEREDVLQKSLTERINNMVNYVRKLKSDNYTLIRKLDDSEYENDLLRKRLKGLEQNIEFIAAIKENNPTV